jgi:hypothetical protein
VAAKGNEIIVTADPKGTFMEGLIASGQTPYPGTIMQIDPTVALVGGRFTFKMYDRSADGDRPFGPYWVLRHDVLQGKTATDAYAAGDRAFLYAPIAGEELNCIVQDPSGTGSGTTYAAGTEMIVDDGTGELIPTTGSPQSAPFVLLEAATQLAGDTLNWVMFSGY